MLNHQMSFDQPAQINSLPLEILSSIFVTIVDASLYARSIGDNSYGSCEYPTLISSVCAHWRRVSISAPHLWAYIDLTPFNEHRRNLKHVKLWLERSQNSPLHLRLGKGGEREETQTSFLMSSYHSLWRLDSQLASILLAAAPHVKSFTPKPSYPEPAVEILSALLPEQGQCSIRELVLRQNTRTLTRDSQPLPQWLPVNIRACLLEPLHVLHLERIGITLSAIPCRNLVELQLIYPSHPLSLVEFVQLLESNPGLHTIVLVGLPLVHIPASSEVQSIRLPSLRRVHISMIQDFVAWFFILLAPGPYELDLHLTCPRTSYDTSFMDALISFFQKTRVKSLIWQIEGVPLTPLFASLPYVQRLGLSLLDLDAITFAGLESTANLLPRLHTIELNECHLKDYSNLDPGLRALLSLPSVQRIRHSNCGNWDSVWLWKVWFVELLEGAGLTATIIHASTLGFDSSPFR